MSDERDDDPDRDAILRRRNRFVAVALSGVAAASLGACAPCLRPAFDASASPSDAGELVDAGRDAAPPSEDGGDAGALSDGGASDAGTDAGDLDPDAGSDAGEDDAGTDPSDAGPLPCLTPIP